MKNTRDRIKPKKKNITTNVTGNPIFFLNILYNKNSNVFFTNIKKINESRVSAIDSKTLVVNFFLHIYTQLSNR